MTAAQQEVVEAAFATIRELFAKYGITSQATATVEIRKRFTQPDFDTYQNAKALLMGSGALDDA